MRMAGLSPYNIILMRERHVIYTVIPLHNFPGKGDQISFQTEKKF